MILNGRTRKARNMKTKMIRAVIAAICIAAALPSWAADGRLVSPVYSMGLFDPSTPTSSTPILQTPRLAFKGITLDELKAMVDEGYSLFGCMIGSYVTARGTLGGFYNLQSYPQSGPVEKIVGDFAAIPRSGTSGAEQAVCVEFTNGEGGVYVVSTKRLYKNSRTSAGFAFVTLNASGVATYAGELRNNKLHEVDLATSNTAAGYGVCGVQCGKFVPAAAPSLVWPGATLNSLKSAAFSGFFGGAAVPRGLATTGYNTKVTADGSGNVTEVQTEYQVLDGDKIRCVVVKFTDGTGGIYAQAVASLYDDSSVGLGYAFTNADGTYNGTAADIATDYTQDSTTSTRQGVYGLTALRSGCTSTGFLTTTSELIWPGVTLDDIKDCYFGGTTDGRYVGFVDECIGCNKSVAVNGEGAATSITIEFQANDGGSPANCLKCVRAEFTNGADGVHGRATRACFSWNNDVGFVFGPSAGMNNTNTTVATSSSANGYGVKNLFVAPCTRLERDEDWSAMSGTGTINLGDTVVDLNGHNLVVRGLTANGGHVAIVNGKAKDTATLEFAIATGSAVNTGVSVGKQYIQSGNVKVVKSGSGTLTASAVQCNTEGFEVAAGTLAMGVSRALGAKGGQVVVRSGATLDAKAMCDLSYDLVLDGGTFQNVDNDVADNMAQLASVRLTKDSSFNFQRAYGLIGPNFTPTTLDLGGNKLSVSIGSVNFYLFNATVMNGTVDITSGGTLKLDKTGVVATNVDFKLKCALNVVVPFKVRNYESAYVNNYNWGSYPVSVLGTFKPTTQYYHGCEMQDGSTMDLTAWPSDLGWPMYSRFNDANKTMSFADGTVNVLLDMSRSDMVTLAKTRIDGNYAGYLLKWGTEAGTLATRNTNTRFALDAESARKYQLVANGTGLLLRPKRGLMIIVK